MDLDQLSSNEDVFTGYLKKMGDVMTRLTQDIKLKEAEISKEKKLDSSHLSDDIVARLPYKPLVYIHSPAHSDESFHQILPDRSNVYYWHGNQYVSLNLYLKETEGQQLKLQLATLQLNQRRINTIDDIALKTQRQIKRNQALYQILVYRRHLEQLKTTIATSINAEDLINPEQNILDLFNHVKQTDTVKAKERFLQLIETYGMIDANQQWIVSKITQQPICCLHKKEEVLEHLLDQFFDPSAKGGQFCRICHEQIGDLPFDEFGGFDTNDTPVILREGSVAEDAKEDDKEEQKGDLPDEALKGPQLTSYKEHPHKAYAFLIIQYLRQTEQIKISDQDMVNAINLYNMVTKVRDLNSQVNLNSTNIFVKERVRLQYEQYYKEKKQIADQKTIDTLSKLSLILSQMMDQYILVIISVVMTLELGDYATYLTMPDESKSKRLIDQMIEQQTSIKFNDNTLQITNNGKALMTLPVSQLVKGDRQLPYLGQMKDAKPSVYMATKMLEYYEILIDYPDLKVQYDQAYHLLEQTEQRKEVAVDNQVDPELLLTVAPEVKFSRDELINVNSDHTYDQYSNQITQRLTYLTSLRVIRVSHLSEYVFHLINQDTDLINNIAKYVPEKNCPTDLRYLYVTYLMELKEEDVATEQGKVGGLTRRPYDISGQQEEFSVLETLSQDEPLHEFKTQIADIDHEIAQLNQYRQLLLHTVTHNYPVDRIQIVKSFKPANEVNIYDPAKKTQWRQLQTVPVNQPNPKLMDLLAFTHDQQPITLLSEKNNDDINRKATYVAQMLGNQLNLNSEDYQKYLNILTNLCSTDRLFKESLKNTQELNNKYNYQWNEKIIEYLIKKNLDHRASIHSNLLKGAIFFLHYVIAIIRHQYVVETTDVNENTTKLLDEFKDEAIKSVFEQYKYVLTNEMIDTLVGVGKQDDKSLDQGLYWSPEDVKKILNYGLLEELAAHFRLLNSLSADTLPSKNTTDSVVYCQFIAKYLDLVMQVTLVNDATAQEYDNHRDAYVAKSIADYQRKKNKMNKEESFLQNHLRHLFKTKEFDEDVVEDVPRKEKLTKEEAKDMMLAQGQDISRNNLQGGDEFENDDLFGDDDAYHD